MKKFIFTIFICFALVGCSDDNDNFAPFPESPESKAQQKFYNSSITQKLKDEGIQLTCEEFCLNVTDEQLELLNQFGDRFLGLKRKFKYMRLSKYDVVHFTHPVGDYILLLPYNVTSEQLEEMFFAFDRLFALEDQTGSKVFLQLTQQKYIDALEVLISNQSDLAPLNLEEIYITDDVTSFSSLIQIAEMNVETINSSFATVVSRLNLFFAAYSKIPGLDLHVSKEDSSYSFIEKIIDHANEINNIISPHRFILSIGSRKDDYYVSGKSFWHYWVSLNSDMTIDKNLDLLSYEAYIANLNDSLKIKVSHNAAISSYTKYPDCQKKLPYLEKNLAEKAPKLKNIFIDYGIFTPDVKSHYKDEELFLNCSKDSVEEMEDVINEI